MLEYIMLNKTIMNRSLLITETMTNLLLNRGKLPEYYCKFNAQCFKASGYLKFRKSTNKIDILH